MATIKSFTDLSQAKEVAEILPLESADMCWQYQKDRWVGEPDYKEFPQFEHATDKRDIPCWSLSALLGVLPSATLDSSEDHHYRLHCMERYTEWYDNPVDACVAMIKRLHELKLL